MSVIVKGMRMSEKCPDCNFESEHGFCLAKSPDFCGYTDELVRPEWCPLVDLGKHGDLIDRDTLIKFVEDRYEITWESDCYEGGIKDACSDILEKIDTMPTVIEAEDSE